jgi:nicotinate-nucleotide adenylyltransferase
MRLGIFGGTFDPVHYGHLLLAEQCLEHFRLDEVWFVPVGVPPHKPHPGIAGGKARAEMLELAVAGHEKFRVDRREIERTEPCYTIDSLREVRAEDPSRELYFLLGADSLHDFPTWREPDRILELARLAVVNRGAAAKPDLQPLQEVLAKQLLERIEFLSIPGIEISASDIRRRVREGKSIRFMTPRAVECYIETHRPYSRE